MPSFYCQDVFKPLLEDEVRVLAYNHAPGNDALDLDAIDLVEGDLIVVCNTYGLAARSPLRGPLPKGVTVVEDHTHDPLSEWARSSAADFAFASLRKWLPLPDGAALWSPANRSLPVPRPLDATHAAATLDRLSAMVLKAQYLGGRPVDKSAYRSLAIAGEDAIGRGPPAGMSALSRALLASFPVPEWRRTRRRNFDTFVRALGPTSLRVLAPQDESVPFGITLVTASKTQREHLRQQLVVERIYPAVLWSIDGGVLTGIPEAHVELSERVVTLHCDHRYTNSDIERVAHAVRRAIGADAWT